MNNDLVKFERGDGVAIFMSIFVLVFLVVFFVSQADDASVQPAMPSEISEAPTP